MQHVKDIVGSLVPGNYYLVDTLRIRDDPMYEPDAGVYYHEKVYIVPVLGPAHEELSLPPHFHVDQRFMSNKLLKKFGVALLATDDILIEARSMRCVRSKPEFPVISRQLHEDYRGVVMKDMTCPHKGAYLGNVEPIQDCIRCPMHGLTFKCDTGEVTDPVDDDQPILLAQRKTGRFGTSRLTSKGIVRSTSPRLRNNH